MMFQSLSQVSKLCQLSVKQKLGSFRETSQRRLCRALQAVVEKR